MPRRWRIRRIYWIERASARAAGEPGTNFFAIASDGSPVGIVGVFGSDYGTATAEITSMWIAPQARGHALGARLVEAAIEWATAAGYSAMELWVTRRQHRRRTSLRQTRLCRDRRGPTASLRPVPQRGADALEWVADRESDWSAHSGVT